MAKTGINFERCNVGAVELHNDRAPEYLESVERSGRKLYIFQDRQHLNRSWVNHQYEGTTCAEIFENQKVRYKEVVGQEPNLEDRTRTNKKTGKQITVAGWSPIREGVCPIKEDTKLDDFKPFIDWCSRNGLTVIRIDLHYDEGYESEKDGRKYNRHAHIVVDWMNWKTAKTAKLGKDKMSEAQDVIADALGMERGEKKAENGKKHLSPAEFREKQAEEHCIELEKENANLKKENDTLFAQHIDTWKYKNRAKQAEASLEAEKSSRIEDNAKYEEIVGLLQEALEESKRQAIEARKELAQKNEEHRKEIEELQIKIGRVVQKNRELEAKLDNSREENRGIKMR